LEFCPTCKTLLLEDRKKKIFLCKKCGFEKATNSSGGQRFVESLERPRETLIVKEGGAGSDEPLPATKAECKKCGNLKAYYWMMQTRGADEPSTRFYRCTECGHTWREYE
jgi:DNA-directed RNA polymerase subunit M